jgi:hypothetical protein
MKRRGTVPMEAPEGFVKGKIIQLEEWHDWMIALDINGHAICYLGYFEKNNKSDIPYYDVSVASRIPKGRETYCLVQLIHGSLRYARFFDDDSYYKVLDNRSVSLPVATNNYFGVFDKDTKKEDKELTRQLFGGTISEIGSCAVSIAKLFGRYYGELFALPRVTFSKTRENSCDLTGCLIPRNFPYIAFDQSEYDWSHVSLFGFYRLLNLLCPTSRVSPIMHALEEDGIDESFLARFIECVFDYGRLIQYADTLYKNED